MLNWWTSKFQSNRILSSTLSPALPLHMRSPPKIVEPFGCLPSWLDIPRIVAGTNTAPNRLLDLFRPGLVRLCETFEFLIFLLCSTVARFFFLQWRAHAWVVCDRVRLTSPCALLAVTPRVCAISYHSHVPPCALLSLVRGCRAHSTSESESVLKTSDSSASRAFFF